METKKIAAIAETHYAQIAPHLYAGPIEAAANLHVDLSTPNFLIQESIGRMENFHSKILKKPLPWENGYFLPTTEPGLGVELNEEVAIAKEKWHKQVLCEHLVYLRGVEIVYFEFREILLDLALNKLRNVLDPKNTGKVKPVLTKFLEEHFLKRLGALIRFSHA